MYVKIASYPARGNPNNPYVDLFYDALEPYEIVLASELKIEIEWLNNCQVDAIHFHWPDCSWRDYSPPSSDFFRSFLSAKIPAMWRFFKYTDQLKIQPWCQQKRAFINKLKGYLYFRKFLVSAHQSGVRIIWTFHNSENHEGSDFIDHLGYKYLAKSTDLVIFHSKIAQNDFLKHYQLKGQSVVMPHGNYDGVYPLPRSKQTILDELGLRSDRPVVSCLGMLRSYKGLDIATSAIKLLDGEVQFLCAGWPHPDFDLAALEKQISVLPNAVLVPKFLSNQEFADYAAISDCLLMPYKKITGSGALLAALTLSRGVVASDLPYFHEVLANHSDAGMLVASEAPHDFAVSINKFLKKSPQLRSQSARNLAKQYSWAKVIPPVAKIINSWSNG